MVGVVGLEPTTNWLRVNCATNCATHPDIFNFQSLRWLSQLLPLKKSSMVRIFFGRVSCATHPYSVFRDYCDSCCARMLCIQRYHSSPENVTFSHLFARQSATHPDIFNFQSLRWLSQLLPLKKSSMVRIFFGRDNCATHHETSKNSPKAKNSWRFLQLKFSMDIFLSQIEFIVKCWV